MKRFSKIFSGIAAIMLGVGIILIAFGLGSARSDWEKIKAAQQGSDRIQQEFDGVKRIEIDIPFGYLEVVATNGNKVRFEAADVRADALKIRKDGGTLEIEMDGGKKGLSGLVVFPLMLEGDEDFSVQGYRLLLPEDYSGKLDIELGTGKLWICGINASELDVCVDAGELVVTECSAEELEAECNIGECSVDGIFRDISAKNHIGVLNARIYGSNEDYDGVITCNIGELEYYMGVEEERSFEDDIVWVEAWDRKGGVDVRKKWKGSAAKGKLEIQCGIGDVTVVFVGADGFDTWQVDKAGEAADRIPEDTMSEVLDTGMKSVDELEAVTGIETSDGLGD